MLKKTYSRLADLQYPMGKLDIAADRCPWVHSSERLDSVPFSGIRKMFDMATPGAINLGIGEPDFQPPHEAIDGLCQACRDGMNKYGPTNGILQLREAVAVYSKRYGKEVEAKNVIITPGGTAALITIMQSFVNPGDEVLIPDPGFLVYRPHVMLAGGVPIEYPLTEEGFQPDIDAIAELIGPRTKAIIVNSPSNPTGGVISKGVRNAIMEMVADHGLFVVSDEVYDRFIYEGEHHSFLCDLDHSIVVNAFSKSLAATGWRIGYAISNAETVDQIGKMQYHMTACPNTPVQFGVLKAMPVMESFISSMIPVFRKRRDIISKRIRAIEGFEMVPPQGSFYAFPSYDMGIPSADLSMRLMGEGLICTPGSSFGPAGEGHLRFSYATTEDKIEKGMDILERVVGRMKGTRR